MPGNEGCELARLWYSVTDLGILAFGNLPMGIGVPLNSFMTSSNKPIVIFGEALYDCFPDGRKVPGGAPFNVAWNLQAFGASPFFVSAVGQDAMGTELKEMALNWGLAVHGIQHTPEHATSTVQVELDEGAPSYTIVENTAMDQIKVPAILSYDSDSILYHGSLAVRSDASMESLRSIREQWKGPVFVDVNIRKPWFDAQRFAALLTGVDYLKVNDEEFEQLSGERLSKERMEAQVAAFAKRFEIRTLILTCGKEGAYWYEDRLGLIGVPAHLGEPMVDTVGAGDAFASVCLLGIQLELRPQDILKRASAFAGKVCTIRGATSSDQAFYDLV